jgi:[acyl-carrier-protein] S-malonyltransferase
MGLGLLRSFDCARRCFDEASDVLGVDVGKLCFGGGAADLSKTAAAQPAIFTLSYAMNRVCETEFSLKPSYGIGHSLGEYTALACAGALGFADALRLVQKRGEAMQQEADARAGGMLALSGCGAEEIEAICRELSKGGRVAQIACYNSRRQTVVSGSADALDELKGAMAGRHSVKAAPLAVSGAFHSSLMSPAAAKLNETLAETTFAPLSYPVISNVTALPHTAAEAKRRLAEQMTAPVLWAQGMEYLKGQGVKIFVEIGPGHALRDLARGLSPDSQAYAFDDAGDMDELSCLMEKIKRRHALSLINRCLFFVSCTPNANLDKERHETGVLRNHSRLLDLKKKVAEGALEFHENMATDPLREILATKKVAPERLDAIIADCLESY